MALALLIGLFVVPGLATVSHAFGSYPSQVSLTAPAHYQTVAEVHRVYHRVYRDRYYYPAPGYYYGPPYYDYYYNQPGFSIGLPFFYFHAG